ncbi:MAG: isocitrate dehydrogenase [Spirochaetes bacterium RIFOXYC1_FULL_54_7]|nr:MAG: isocitrate dehydrogenase [Spirochaetes bacterium RIFOXYC1_FULL_54_7]
MHTVVQIPGDGIGPEVSKATRQIVEATGVNIRWVMADAGAQVLKETGELVAESTYQAIATHGVVLKGPITTPIGTGFRSVNVSLRQKYDLFANIRPIRSLDARAPAIDFIIFRENTEDLYAGREIKISDDEVHAIKVITRGASTRIAKAGFDYARANGRKTVTAVHKANIMKLADGLFLEAFRAVAASYPEIATNEVIVDNMCMQLVMRPDAYDVIVTENLYGDILSDLGAGLIGGLGLVPSANIGTTCAIFEAVHGSAPDIAGKGMANPIALTLSAALMLDHLGEQDAAKAIRESVEAVMRDKSVLTPDLGGKGNTDSLTRALIAGLH